MWKAVKNETEVKNERIAHLKDGIAITKMLYWLRHTDKKQESEISVSDKLEEFRRLDEDYLGPSFDTISGMQSMVRSCIIVRQSKLTIC